MKWRRCLAVLARWCLVSLLLGGAVPAPAASATSGDGLALALVGDVMPGSYASGGAVPAGDGEALFKAAEPWLQTADLALGNFEDTLGGERPRVKPDCARCYALRSPERLAEGLRKAGFDGWSQANNHARDFGDAGVAETRTLLMRHGMASTGPDGEAPARWQVRGLTVCLLAFAPNHGMQDLRDIPEAAARVRRALANGCTLVLVTFHGGAEGPTHQHTPKGDERFLGEDRGNVRAFAHAMVDAGAALVFGQGPHVLRGMELWQGRLILYSLGNFLTHGGISVAGPMGWSVVARVRLARDGRFEGGVLHSFIQQRLAPLVSDTERRAARSMEALTREDFGGGGLVFGRAGHFQPATLSRYGAQGPGAVNGGMGGR